MVFLPGLLVLLSALLAVIDRTVDTTGEIAERFEVECYACVFLVRQAIYDVIGFEKKRQEEIWGHPLKGLSHLVL
jgi:hypothetical protein